MSLTLVTGATGLVGFNIVQQLLMRGRAIRVLARNPEKAAKLFGAADDQLEIVPGDITRPQTLVSAFDGCDVVYHAAGHPEQWKRNPRIFNEVNVLGTQNMINAAMAQGIRKFIYTSTIDVFEAGIGRKFDETHIDQHPKGTHYERSKQRADFAVSQALEAGLPAIFVHPAAVYGPGPTDSPGVNDFILKLYRKEAPVLLPGGFPLVLSIDAGAGHVMAEEHGNIGGRYILSESYQPLTVLAQAVLQALGEDRKPPPVLPLPLARVAAIAGERIANLINKPPLIPIGQLHFLQWQATPDASRAIKGLNWKPTPLAEGLRQTIAYLLPERPH